MIGKLACIVNAAKARHGSTMKRDRDFHGIFRQENPFNEIMSRIFDLALLNILWLVCCLPVITIGASTTALYYVALKMVRDEDAGITKQFFHSFRQNFRQSVPITLCLLVITGLFAFNFHQFGKTDSGTSAFSYGVTITLAVLIGAVCSYIFPLLSHFANSTANILRNAAKLAMSHLWQTAVIVLIHAVPAVLLAWFPELFARIFVFWCVLGTSVSAYVVCLILDPVFQRLEPQEPALHER